MENKKKKVNGRSTEELLRIKGDMEEMISVTRKIKKRVEEKFVDSQYTYKTNRVTALFYGHILSELKHRGVKI